MLRLEGERLDAYSAVEATYNKEVATKFIEAMDAIVSEFSSNKMLDTVAVALLVSKSILGQYAEQAYPNKHTAPVDLRNLLYYTEQNMASLAQQFMDNRDKEEPSMLIL